MPKSKKQPPNFFALRIHNSDTLRMIEEMLSNFKNRNAVLNEALDLGAPILYARIFGGESKAEKAKQEYRPSVARELKELRRVIDDLFIENNVIEMLLAALFNAKVAALGGEEVNAEALLDGSMCDLPELVAGLKADLTGNEDRNGQ